MRPRLPNAAPAAYVNDEACPVCGSEALREVKCKVICTNCRTILKSCADL